MYSTKFHTRDLHSHELGTHAAPWFLSKAIRSSEHYSADLEEADIVYVDGRAPVARLLQLLQGSRSQH